MKKLIVASALSVAALMPTHAGFLFPVGEDGGFIWPDEVDRFDWFYYDYASNNPAADPYGVNYSNAAPHWGIVFDPNRDPYLEQSNPEAILTTTDGDPRIYSHSGPMHFTVHDQASYDLGSVFIQFQTKGTEIDLSSMKLIYTVGGNDFELTPTESLREYRDGSMNAYGFEVQSRLAFQWDLGGMEIDSYRIVWSTETSGISHADMILSTSNINGDFVPRKATYTGGSGQWSNAANWSNGTGSNENGNVGINTTGPATITIDSSPTVGELRFQNAHDVTIEGSGELRLNTGIVTEEDATGNYTITSDVAFGAFNVFDIKSGVVTIDGDISSDASDYGLIKKGDGTLILTGNNTFGNGIGDPGTLGLLGGILRIEGTNEFGGAVNIIDGELIIANHARANEAGALGNSDRTVTIGASDETYGGEEPLAATLTIDGAWELGRNVDFQNGNFVQTLKAINTTAAGARVTGNVSLRSGTSGFSRNVAFVTGAASDRLIFEGAIANGSINGANLVISGPGTVVYKGVNKTYNSATKITSGTLLLESGTSMTGNTAITIESGAHFVVNGTVTTGLGAALNINSGGRLSGSGTIQRSFTVGSGARIAAGNSVGKLATRTQTWAGGGINEVEIGSATNGTAKGTGWDYIEITGDLVITSTEENPFIISLSTLDSQGLAGELGLFDGLSDNRWTILSVTGSIINFDPTFFRVDLTDDYLATINGTFSMLQSGQDLVLYYEVIPEPSTYALFGLGAAAYAWQRRRKARRQDAA